MSRTRVPWIFSLKTQLFAGAVLLLGATVSTVGYVLIVQQERSLTGELERAVILQGRNIALTSEKPLLRSDPEFELYPLITRLLQDTPELTDVTVVDSDGIIQGHRELTKVAQPYRRNESGLTPRTSLLLGPNERLFESEHEVGFVTSVISAGQGIGTVYITYSKAHLHAGIARAVRVTMQISAGALLLGLILSIIFFRHIARPMNALMSGVASLARGDLSTRITMESRNEFRVLASAFNDMSGKLESSRGELIAKERMDRELELAAEIQSALIPDQVTAPKGFEIGHFYRAASQVGGDYVDVIPISGGRIGLVMADVSGKGVPGLVVMAMVKVLAQQLVTSGASPSEVLRQLNVALRSNMQESMFVTMFVGVLDATTQQLSCANAGHNPIILFDGASGTSRLFKMEGVPLGAFDATFFNPTVRDYRHALAPGDLVLQYTDGLNESRTAGGRQLGIQKVMDLVTLYAKYGAPTLVSRLILEEKRFRGDAPQSDDITLLSVGAVAPVRESLEDPVPV